MGDSVLEQVKAKVIGPCVILAGAGTGKTYTIIEKLKHLIISGTYAPRSIVCLTFSNEAVNTIQKRMLDAMPNAEQPLVRTFHGFCADFLREHGQHSGVRTNFAILLPDDAKVMLHKNLRVHPQLCSKYIETIGVAKDLGITMDSLREYVTKKTRELGVEEIESSLRREQVDLNTAHLFKTRYSSGSLRSKREQVRALSDILKIKRFLQTWAAYEKLKEKRNLLDYADLNVHALAILRKHPEIAQQYEYVIVDEFQDTNKRQIDLLEYLAAHKNITIVGDLNQAIYRFRGAYKENITQFKSFFQPTKEDFFALNQSRRSPNTVLRTAHKLIEHNYANKEECFKVLNHTKREGTPIHAIRTENEQEEVRRIVQIIEAENNKGISLEEICVLYRTHQQARRLKSELERKNIPFTSVQKPSLLENVSLKSVLSYICIAHAIAKSKKGGEQAWWTILHSLDLTKHDLSLLGAQLKKFREQDTPSKELFDKLSTLKLSEEGSTLMRNVQHILQKTLDSLSMQPSELIRLVYSLAVHTENDAAHEKKKQANLNAFVEFTEAFAKSESGELDDLLYHIDIMKKLRISLPAPASEERGVRIMTHHATKGLEYAIVICACMAQNKFPTERMRSNGLIPSALVPDIALMLKDVPDYAHGEVIEDYEKTTQLAEERRLCYVAFTRAKERLYLTFAKKYGSAEHAPSQFLAEISFKENPDVHYEEDTLLSEQKAPELLPADSLSTLRKKRTFSPSALLLFIECQKKYEYKYLYNMPEKESDSFEEMLLGSFVHAVFEKGVEANFSTEEAFQELARTLYTEEEWRSVNLAEAALLIKVFFQRNRNKFSRNSKTELSLKTTLDGITFEGYADRVDIHPDGIEIIDYKTGKTPIAPKHRNLQLGLYALAAAELGLGPVKCVTLEMLRHEKPLEFELKNDGTARERNSMKMVFSLDEVKRELVDTAKSILACYDSGFKPCDIDADCDFCNEYIWKI